MAFYSVRIWLNCFPYPPCDNSSFFLSLTTFIICPQGDPLQVKVNKLTSIKTQLPYTYYSLPFCKPATIVDSAENLGEVLRGDRIENSPYLVSTLEESKLIGIYFWVHVSDIEFVILLLVSGCSFK
jgi:hypothetical protein